jgi:DNA-binding XRE family transcriptional regulator
MKGQEKSLMLPKQKKYHRAGVLTLNNNYVIRKTVPVPTTPRVGGHPRLPGTKELRMVASKLKSKNRLRELRVHRGIKQLALASQSGIDQSTLSKLECSWFRPSEGQAKKLSAVLKVPLEWLFPELGDQTETTTSK